MKKTDCKLCGAPRKDKLAGLCADCFDLEIAKQHQNVRRNYYAWVEFVAARTAAALPAVTQVHTGDDP